MSHKGDPGPWCAETEAELVEHLVGLFQGALERNELIRRGDGINPEIPVDVYGVRQVVFALKNYRTLLTKPM